METFPESVVVVKYPKGYGAYLYFTNPMDDVILSAGSYYMIHRLVENYLYRKKAYYA